jgi:translocation and assembly module TamB
MLARGTFSIDSGRVGIGGLGVEYSELRLRCAAAGRDVRIDEAEAVSGGGRLRLSGVVSLKEPAAPSVDLGISIDRFLAVQTTDVKALVSGELQVLGELARPKISGGLSLNDSYVVVPEVNTSGDVETVELAPEDYAMLETNFGYRRPVATGQEGPSTIDPTLDLTLELLRNTWVRKRSNPTMAVELQGKVRLERSPEKPWRVTGILKPLTGGRSYVGQFGRQFEITAGEIVLKGPLEETELRMDSKYEVPSQSGSGLSEVVIRMRVEVALGRFTFSLTSDPAMDESEILSYLATGQSKTGALANTADQGGLAGAMALEQLVGAAGGITEESVPIDVFQIRQDGARGITIVAGNYVNPKTYLGIRQPILFNQGTQDSPTESRTQFELEYEAQSWLFLNVQGGSSRLLMFLKARHAY